MTDVSPNRYLQDKGAGDAAALALKVFSGAVLEAFTSATKFWDNTGNVISRKVLTSGKSAQWPIMGVDPTAEDHTPGTFMSGGSIQSTERVVVVDDYLVSYVDVSYADINLAHWDVLAPYAKKLGRALATKMDTRLAYTAMNGSRAAAVSSIHSGGNEVRRLVADADSVDDVFANTSTGAGLFRDDVATLARMMDEDAVPEAGRYLFITPYARMLLRHETDVFNRDYNPDATAGNLNERIIGTMEGFSLIISNNMPSTDVTTGPTAYQGRYDGVNGPQPLGLALCGAAEGSAGVGLVQSDGPTSHIEKDERRNTYFLKSQVMCGADYIAPWCCGNVSWQKE